MKAYLIITGLLFGLLAVMHLLRTIEKWHLLTSDPWFVLGTAAIAAVTGVLSGWACRLLRYSSGERTGRRSQPMEEESL
jgi:hypothetical protein